MLKLSIQWEAFLFLEQLGLKKVPAIEIAGLCLPLKPQKENVMLMYNK